MYTILYIIVFFPSPPPVARPPSTSSYFFFFFFRRRLEVFVGGLTAIRQAGRQAGQEDSAIGVRDETSSLEGEVLADRSEDAACSTAHNTVTGT